MNRPKSLLAAVLALALTLTVGAPVRAEAAFQPSGAVVFKQDDVKKTITVTVKLAFYNRSCSSNASCEVRAADVARIVKSIESMWNTGLKVKCYTFSVKVDARTVGSQSESGQAEVDVGLDYGPVPARAFVRATLHGAGASNAVGNSPDDRVEAVHDPGAPTTWPAHTYEQTYAHEFGHVLGLSDNYDETTKGLLPGASEDLMFRKQGYVTEEMVKRVVERSGQIKLKDLKCGWAFLDATPLGDIKGVKCDTADGDWTVQGEQAMQGQLTLTTLWNVTIDEKSLKGTYTYEAIQKLGPSITTSNSHGSASVVLGDDGSATMTLSAEPISATTVVAGIGSGSATLAPHGWTFDWKPAAAGQCP